MTNEARSLLMAILAAAAILFPSAAEAQWTTQSITLKPGWNAVFLRVQPSPEESDAVFAGIPVESVWTWNRRFTPVQFIQDASALVAQQPDWLGYFPPASGSSALTNLFIVKGGRPYLIKLGGSSPVAWNIRGRPVVRQPAWLSDSYNLTGFPVDPTAPPTFSAWFAASAAHSSGPVYRLGASGIWATVTDLAGTPINPGEAYYVFCRGPSTYEGPVSVALEQGGALDFGRILTELALRIRNNTAFAREVRLAMRASEEPPNAAEPLLAGAVPLSFWEDRVAFPVIPDWAPFPGELLYLIEPGTELSVRLAVRRKDMDPFPAPAGGAGARYQGLLDVTDAGGANITVPVVSRGLASPGGAGGTAGLGIEADEPLPSDPRAGLWVGSATIDKVSVPGDDADPLTPKPAASEFQVRLIVHVDASGLARLLQQVTMLWQEGTMKPDPQDPTKEIVDQPGRYVLVTRDDLLDQLSGAALRDGVPVGRRISTTAFTFRDPVLLNGSFDATLATGTGGIVLGYDDPLNPFKHKYHPEHDNLDYDFQGPRREVGESFDVTRHITLAFTPEDPGRYQIAGWGDNQVGGDYSERITGVHRQELRVAGIFRLQQVSRLPVLNDGR